MKKYALCLSGQPRYIKEGFNLIKSHILDHNDCDVFLHTWYDETTVGTRFKQHSEFNQIITKDIPEFLLENYDPIFYIIEPQINFDLQDYDPRPYDGGTPNIAVFNTHSMFYGIMRANDLKSHNENINNKVYTGVARIRFDWGIHDDIKFDNLDMKYLNVYNDCTHNHLCINDHFAISSSDNMNIYCNTFNKIRSIYDQGCPFCPEILLGYQIHQHQIPQKQLDLKRRPLILRG